MEVIVIEKALERFFKLSGIINLKHGLIKHTKISGKMFLWQTHDHIIIINMKNIIIAHAAAAYLYGRNLSN